MELEAKPALACSRLDVQLPLVGEEQLVRQRRVSAAVQQRERPSPPELVLLKIDPGHFLLRSPHKNCNRHRYHRRCIRLQRLDYSSWPSRRSNRYCKLGRRNKPDRSIGNTHRPSRRRNNGKPLQG